MSTNLYHKEYNDKIWDLKNELSVSQERNNLLESILQNIIQAFENEPIENLNDVFDEAKEALGITKPETEINNSDDLPF